MVHIWKWQISSSSTEKSLEQVDLLPCPPFNAKALNDASLSQLTGDPFQYKSAFWGYNQYHVYSESKL